MSMLAVQTQERAYLSSVLGWELDPAVSRDTVLIAGDANAVRDLSIGTVLGRALFGAPVVAAVQGNAGNGVITAVPGAHSKVGSYLLTCTAAAAHSGRFSVVDPDGERLADFVVGQAYATPSLSLTAAAGAADYVAGDIVAVTIPPGDGRCAPLSLTATDGTQLADCVLSAPIYADIGEDVAAPVIARQATLLDSGLVWPDDITDAVRAASIARLSRLSLLVKASA